jgi:hypothetical protein
MGLMLRWKAAAQSCAAQLHLLQIYDREISRGGTRMSFGLVEAIWAIVALQRWNIRRR